MAFKVGVEAGLIRMVKLNIESNTHIPILDLNRAIIRSHAEATLVLGEGAHWDPLKERDLADIV